MNDFLEAFDAVLEMQRIVDLNVPKHSAEAKNLKQWYQQEMAEYFVWMLQENEIPLEPFIKQLKNTKDRL
jgi:hypothetical protein